MVSYLENNISRPKYHTPGIQLTEYDHFDRRGGGDIVIVVSSRWWCHGIMLLIVVYSVFLRVVVAVPSFVVYCLYCCVWLSSLLKDICGCLFLSLLRCFCYFFCYTYSYHSSARYVAAQQDHVTLLLVHRRGPPPEWQNGAVMSWEYPIDQTQQGTVERCYKLSCCHCGRIPVCLDLQSFR